MEREDQEIGHVVGVGDAGTAQVMREARAFIKAPVVDHPGTEAAVQQRADGIFRDNFDLCLRFGRNIFVEFDDDFV